MTHDCSSDIFRRIASWLTPQRRIGTCCRCPCQSNGDAMLMSRLLSLPGECPSLSAKTFPSGQNGSVRVDALHQSRQTHPGCGLVRARHQYHVSRCRSPSDRSFAVSSSDSARAFWDAPESTCSYGGAFRTLRDLTIKIVKFSCSWDRGAALRETWCHIFKAVVLRVPKSQGISYIIFIFVTVTRFATLYYGMHYLSISIYIHTVNLATTEFMRKNRSSSRSLGRKWEDMILPGHENPHNCVDPDEMKMRWKWDDVYLPRGLPNMYSRSLCPPPLPLYLRTPAVAH